MIPGPSKCSIREYLPRDQIERERSSFCAWNMSEARVLFGSPLRFLGKANNVIVTEVPAAVRLTSFEE